MFDFIRIQFKCLHRLTADQVRAFVPRWITAEQAVEITGEEYAPEGVQ